MGEVIHAFGSVPGSDEAVSETVLVPDPFLISELELILNDAKSGLIRGFAVAYTTANGGAGSTWVSPPRTGIGLLGAVSLMKYEMTEEYAGQGSYQSGEEGA